MTYLVLLWPVCPRTSCRACPSRAWSCLGPAEPPTAPASPTGQTPGPWCSPSSDHSTHTHTSQLHARLADKSRRGDCSKAAENFAGRQKRFVKRVAVNEKRTARSLLRVRPCFLVEKVIKAQWHGDMGPPPAPHWPGDSVAADKGRHPRSDSFLTSRQFISLQSAKELSVWLSPVPVWTV